LLHLYWMAAMSGADSLVAKVFSWSAAGIMLAKMTTVTLLSERLPA